MIEEISFVVKDLGEFNLTKNASVEQICFWNDHDAYWSSVDINVLIEIGSTGFRKSFIEETRIRISEQEAIEIWQNIVMFYGFISK